MFRGGVGYSAGFLVGLSLLLAGCGARDTGTPHPMPAAGKQGIVHGGEEPVSGATIQLYAVGTNAIAAPATPLIGSTVLTDANGNFTITGTYNCPSASTLVYLTATGGNPGLPAGTNNTALALMAALGPCGNLSPSTFISLNELTTVAAVYALAPYMTSLSAVGSDPGNATALANAFVLANELVNTTTGTAPGTNVPAGSLVPVQQINTIADILASCVNTAGGVAGDNSACGSLFSLTTLPAGSTAPSNTVAALLQIAMHPAVNTAALYSLIPATAPFQPQQPQVPPDLSVQLLSNAGLTVTPTVLNFPATRVGNTIPQLITITNNTSTPVGLDAVDSEQYSITGTDPGDFSPYSGPAFPCPTPLLPGSSCTVQITFKPTATGPRTAYYILPNTSANPSIAVALNGTGLEATAGPASLNPSSLNLVAAGSPSPITLTNSGTGPLTIDRIAISNDPTSGQPAFSQTNNCGSAVAPAGTCTISITALATTQPYSTGVLTVYDDAASGPQTANLSYSNGFSGPVVLSFPSLSVGMSFTDYLNQIQPYPNPVTLTITGPNATDFSFSTTASVQTATCTSYSRPPTDCSNPIVFTPSGQGVRTATLNVNGDQFNGPYGGLVGVGLPPGLHFAVLNLPYTYVNPSPLTSLQFGYVTTGQSSSNPAQILNNGTVPVTLNAPVLTGPAASDFSVSSCTTLAPGAICQVTVAAHPTQPGLRAATLTFTDSTGTASSTVSLSVVGTYPAPVVNPSALNFPYTPEGSVSAPISFTITANNNDPVFLRVDQDGPTSPFVFPNGYSCPQTPCTLSAVYEPTPATSGSGGDAGTTIYVYDLFTLGPTQVGVTGTYLPPYVLSISPASLSFGTQPFGTLSNPQQITITNQGTQTVNFTLAFSPDGSVTTNPNYMAGSNGALFVNPGDNVTLSVTFAPTVMGQDNATLYVLSSASSSPNAIQLTGTAD